MPSGGERAISMDLGIFLSNRRYILIWALTPLAVLAIFYFSLYGYFKSKEGVFRADKSFIESVPLISQKISAAEELLKEYDLALSKTETIEKMNSQLKEMARLADLTVTAINIDTVPGSTDSGPLFKVNIKSEGEIGAITAFVGAVQASGMLLTIDSANIKSCRNVEGRKYSAYFVFSYHTLQ
jgi:hypothetical protein